MLPDSCDSLWRTYLASEKIRIRAQTTATLRAFIDELSGADTALREQWARSLAKNVVDDAAEIPVRMPLFREVLFPALVGGYENGEKGCARWLAGFAQLLYNSPECLARLPESSRSEHGLLLRAIERDPDDYLAKQKLLRILRSRFEYALHELPAGVLYAANGATVAQCDEMEEELCLFESLGRECGTQDEDRELVEDARFHISTYRDYLLTRTDNDNYESFLGRIKK